MSKISILTASLASMLCMVVLFVGVALAAGPAPQTGPAGAKGAPAPQGLCFLHRL